MRRLLCGFLAVAAGAAWAHGELLDEPVVKQRPAAVAAAPFASPARAAPAGLAAPNAVQAATPAARPAVDRAAPGSLYSDSTFQSLTSDRRVHRVGDLVTVLIFENASASSSADTGAARDGSVGVNVTSPADLKRFGVGANNDFNGMGRTQRAGKILAQLTVTVREITPNQDLLIAGEQLLEINGEKQVIRLEGRARPRDINEMNNVLSTRIADARISFIGDGVIADRQRPGWWQHVLGLFGL